VQSSGSVGTRDAVRGQRTPAGGALGGGGILQYVECGDTHVYEMLTVREAQDVVRLCRFVKP
jgi:hypothetical protein